MPTNQVTISKEQFDNGDIPLWNSNVIVEMEHSSEGYTTKSGIIVGFNTDVTYGSLDGDYRNDTESHAADVAEVYGRVVRIPTHFDYVKEDVNHMSWLPHMEVDIGDYVWFNPLISKNCSEIIVDHKRYKVIPYEDLFVARKGGREGRVVPLNGNCLLERIYPEKKSKFDVITGDKPYADRGKVVFVGKPNIEYQNEAVGDIPDVETGVMAYFTPGYIPILLERKAFMAGFDGDNIYYAVQRKRIGLTVKE